MTRLLLAVLGLLLAAIFAGSASAQCATIHGSGCPGAKGAPHCVTPPQIGTAFAAHCPDCGHERRSFLALGTPLHSPIVIGPPLACGHQLCNLSCSLLAFLHGSGLRLHIPNDHHLVGLSLCVQCACLDPTAGCLELSLATRVTITS